MLKIAPPVVRAAALTILIGGLAVASPLSAAFANMPDSSGDAMGQKQDHARAKEDQSPQAMKQRVEDRINTLRDKLGITSAQETKWGEVAQTMRDNEAVVSQLIQARHQDPQNMTAIDDLQSYEKIASAHVEGLQKLIPVFQSLYNDMPDDQKKRADNAFGHFEGHSGDKSAMKRM
jgi:protein CpxP